MECPRRSPMSLAPSVAVSRSRFNPLPLYITLFCLLWSFAFVAGKIGVTDCPPLILLAARFLLAGVLILGERLTWRKVAGLLLGILGVGLIVWHRMSVGTDSLHGIFFTLASLASIVTGTILFKVLAPKGSLWIGNGVQNLAGGLALLPFAFTLADVHDIVPSARLLGAFAFLVLGGSILAYLLWFHLLKVCGATAASAYHFLMPPLGMLFAFLVLGEHVETRDLLGIVPVALGIYLVTRPGAVQAVRSA